MTDFAPHRSLYFLLVKVFNKLFFLFCIIRIVLKEIYHQTLLNINKFYD